MSSYDEWVVVAEDELAQELDIDPNRNDSFRGLLCILACKASKWIGPFKWCVSRGPFQRL